MKNQKSTLEVFEMNAISKIQLKTIQGCAGSTPPAGSTGTSTSSPDGGGSNPPHIAPPPLTK